MNPVEPSPSRPAAPEPTLAPETGARGTIGPAEAFRRALPLILRMAHNRGFDPQLQRDVAQDTGKRLLESWAQYDPCRGSELQWTIGIALRVMHNAQRRRRVERRVLESGSMESIEARPAPELTPEQHARARATLEIVNATLTEQECAIFELKAERRTAAEIGDLLGLAQWRVEQLIREARARLARRLQRLGEDPDRAADVRATLLPFLSIDDTEEALRDRRPAPPGRFALSAPQIGAGLAVVFLFGAVMGSAALGPARTARSGTPAPIVAEPARDLAATAPPTAAATAGANALPATPTAPRNVVRTVAPEASSVAPRTSAADSADRNEKLLLLRAAKLSPAVALDLARAHAKQFPAQNVGKRELVMIRALLALGRRSEAEARARALAGTPFERDARSALQASAR